MAAEHELPDRQDQWLDTQKQGVHKADSVNRMQGKPLKVPMSFDASSS